MIKYETTETTEEYSVYSKIISFKYKGKVVGKHRVDYMIEDKI